tara:strand:+ start:919 stop:1095 length:177 start_codon:yes stop_codon:yes gene_type:complete
MGQMIEIESSINDCMVFDSFEEAQNEIEELKILEPENEYIIKELTEEEAEKYELLIRN